MNASTLLKWEELMNLLEGILNNTADGVRWALEKSGKYSTKSMYRWMAHRGVVNKRKQRFWGSKLPMKLKIFLWQVCSNKLQTRVELKRRNWEDSHLCGICGCPETVGHILFYLCYCTVYLCLFQRSHGGGKEYRDIWKTS